MAFNRPWSWSAGILEAGMGCCGSGRCAGLCGGYPWLEGTVGGVLRGFAE